MFSESSMGMFFLALLNVFLCDFYNASIEYYHYFNDIKNL